MKFYHLVCYLFFAQLGWSQLPLRFGAIDQNDQDRNVAWLNQSYATPAGQVLVIFDFAVRRNRFLRFNGTTATTFYLANLDEFDYTIQASHGPFLLINDRPRVLQNQATQLDVRTGTTRRLFTSQAGFTFSAAVGDGYVYADGSRNLWGTDGTEAGTYLIAADAVDFSAHQLGDRLVLGTSVGLFVTDGTLAGTERLLERPVARTVKSVVYDERLYFIEANILYVSDGTPAGTTDLQAANPDRFSTNLTATPSGVIFVSQTPELGREIWTTDGTSAGTQPVSDLNPGPGNGVGISAGVTSLAGELLFRGGPSGNDEFLYTATPTEVFPLLDLSVGADRENWRPFLVGTTQTGQIHYVTTNHLDNQQVLWRLQANTPAVALDTFGTNAVLTSRSQMVDDALFYQGGEDAQRLYRVNDTTITAIDSVGPYLGHWLASGGHLYYTYRRNRNAGLPEVLLRRVAAATDAVYEHLGATDQENDILPFFEQEGGVFAFSLDSARAEVITQIDGTTPTLVTDLLPYTDRSSFKILEAANAVLYVDYFNEQEALAAILPGANRAVRLGLRANPDALRYPLGDYLLFDNERASIQLAGPTSLQTINMPDSLQLSRYGYTWFAGRIYFLVNNSNSRRTIFHLVRMEPEDPQNMEVIFSFTDLENGLDNWNFAARQMAVADGRLFFPYPSAATGWELGVSDGTAAGTQLYEDILPGPASSAPRNLYGFQDRLVVRTIEANNGNVLYLSLLNQNRTYWYALNLAGDGLLAIDGTEAYTALSLSISNRGDDEVILIDNDTGAERRVGLQLNSPVYQLSNNRLAFWQGTTRLFVTAGPEQTDETSEDFFSFSAANVAQFGDVFVVPNANYDGGMEAYDVNAGTLTPIPGVINEAPFDLFLAGSRAYFEGISTVADLEVHYLEKGELQNIIGRIFQDDNGNGREDEGELPLAGVQITASGNNSTFAITDTSGHFTLRLDDAERYTVALAERGCYGPTSNPNTFELIPGAFPTDTLLLGVAQTDDAAALRAVISSGTVRCGFTVPFWLTVVNTGCQAVTNDVEFRLPEETTLTLSSPAPTSTEATTLGWASITLAPGETWQGYLELTMPGEEQVGEDIPFALAAVGEYGTDQTIEEQITYTRTLRCAIDPNDKLVQPARVEETNSNYTQIDETLTYTIRFQNTGNDTAINVRLEDQLAPTLDLSSFKPLAASHPYRVVLADDGLLEVYFDNIFLPDSNINEVASHGFFTFDIDLEESALNTTVENTVGIYFDFNAPVITNTVVSTIVEFLDEDQDDYFFWEDCDDQNPEINPGAIDIGGNGIDENCDRRDWTTSTGNPLPGTLTIFPNPVQDRLLLRYSLPQRLLVAIYDGRGRRMQSKVMRSQETLDMGALPPAIYLVWVLEEQTGAERTRVVVKR